MVTELTEKIKSSLKDAAKKLTGFKKRAFAKPKQNWDGLGRQ